MSILPREANCHQGRNSSHQGRNSNFALISNFTPSFRLGAGQARVKCGPNAGFERCQKLTPARIQISPSILRWQQDCSRQSCAGNRIAASQSCAGHRIAPTVLARAQARDGVGPAVELSGLRHIVDAHDEGQAASEERVLRRRSNSWCGRGRCREGRRRCGSPTFPRSCCAAAGRPTSSRASQRARQEGSAGRPVPSQIAAAQVCDGLAGVGATHLQARAPPGKVVLQLSGTAQSFVHLGNEIDDSAAKHVIVISGSASLRGKECSTHSLPTTHVSNSTCRTLLKGGLKVGGNGITIPV